VKPLKQLKAHAATVALVLAALGLVAWLWLDRDRVTVGERKRRDNNVFEVWRREEVARLSIVHEGETIVLERDAKKDTPWRMTSPRDERTDLAAVERLLTTLELATVARKAGETTGLGFESPRASGEIRMGPIVARYQLGGVSPRPEGSGYFRVDDGPAVVVSREVVTALLASSDTLRDRTVVPYLSLELARFEVAQPGGGFILERVDEHAFRVADERRFLAGRRPVDALWSALAEMRAEAFPKDADAERLTAQPRLTITMTPKDVGKPPAILVVGEACPDHPDDVVVLRRAPTRAVACAPRGALDALLVGRETLVDRRPFSLRMDEIEELELAWVTPPASPDAGEGAPGEAPPPRIDVARKGTGFRARAPLDRDLDPEESDAVTELLGRIADSEAESLRSAKDEPAFTAVARAKVRSGEHELAIEVGPLDDAKGHATVRRLVDDARLRVSAAVYRRLVPRATTLRARRIVAAETRRANRVLLQCGSDATPQELVDRGEGLRLVSPTGYETDGSITQLVDAVVRGRVDAWVADADDGSFGFGSAPPCRVVLGFEGGNAPITMTFGGEGESGTYAKVDVRPGVFVASPSLRDLAARLYVSRGGLRTEAARIESVRATLGGKPVATEQARLRDAVSALVADRVIGIGAPAVARLPAPELVIEVSVEAGRPRRIACTSAGAVARASGGTPSGRACTVTGSDVVYLVEPVRLAAFTGAADGGALAPDGGAR